MMIFFAMDQGNFKKNLMRAFGSGGLFPTQDNKKTKGNKNKGSEQQKKESVDIQGGINTYEKILPEINKIKQNPQTEDVQNKNPEGFDKAESEAWQVGADSWNNWKKMKGSFVWLCNYIKWNQENFTSTTQELLALEKLNWALCNFISFLDSCGNAKKFVNLFVNKFNGDPLYYYLSKIGVNNNNLASRKWRDFMFRLTMRGSFLDRVTFLREELNKMSLAEQDLEAKGFLWFFNKLITALDGAMSGVMKNTDQKKEIESIVGCIDVALRNLIEHIFLGASLREKKSEFVKFGDRVLAVISKLEKQEKISEQKI